MTSFCVQGGVRNLPKMAYVLYGWPLTEIFVCYQEGGKSRHGLCRGGFSFCKAHRSCRGGGGVQGELPAAGAERENRSTRVRFCPSALSMPRPLLFSATHMWVWRSLLQAEKLQCIAAAVVVIKQKKSHLQENLLCFGQDPIVKSQLGGER